LSIGRDHQYDEALAVAPAKVTGERPLSWVSCHVCGVGCVGRGIVATGLAGNMQ
jgi:hypothetical protein